MLPPAPLASLLALLLLVTCYLDTVASDSEDCNDDDIWASLGDGFETYTLLPATPEYDAVVAELSAAPTVPTAARKKRQTASTEAWCSTFAGYYLSHAPDGDSCCQTLRARCLWHNAVSDHRQILYPIWRAVVDTNGTLRVRYQYFFDIKCNLGSVYSTLPNTCPACRVLTHERKVLMSIVQPQNLNPFVAGDYGHASLRLADTIFYRFQERSYCCCVL